ncbi:juvenile hormone esterase-like [Trichoplusia ni]|uniref:Juvenile hormone esterase-like n=1 Tax=Trichoplusia ni TaxID=7111 RepID=A0A7E5WTW6_TRINI|nr:juvenile hormone esterase-like [Trichoplusia ni]
MSLWSVKWLVLWSLWAARLVRQPTTTHHLSNGPVRGSIAPDGSHASYLNIPYASMPQRFLAPGPEPKWDQTFEAVNENVRCIQSMADILTIGGTDCLSLNVYTPLNVDPDSRLPVMVFIHGGGFFQGSGNMLIYGPNYLVPKGVILVTMNYRLNIQGFICLRIKEAPGNAGMKDQVAALRWVQRNIRKLGGDPDNVTIFGESAGGASVSFHVLSPMSKGLFHKAITESGSALAPWAYQFRPIFMASLVARTMLFDSQDPHELYKYYMSKSDDELILTRVPRKPGNIIISEILYTPCTEKVIEGVEPFLTESPYDLLSKGEYNKVPLMIGTNNEEGLLLFSADNETSILKVEIEKAIPKNLEFPSQTEKIKVAKELERLYLEGEKLSLETMTKLVKWYGDPYLISPSLEETEFLLKSSEHPIYNYLFSYDGWRNLPKLVRAGSVGNFPGATHADELFYLFSQHIVFSNFEKDMIDKVTTLWTNFAKYGDPTPEGSSLQVKWNPTNATTPTCLVIDSDFSTAPLWFNDRLKYWRDVYSKYRRKR